MENTILINQIGYEKTLSKFAFVDASTTSEKEFSLCNVDGKVVFTGKLNDVIEDELSAQKIACADFSSFSEPGTYKIVCGDQSSFEFKIGEGLYKDIYKSTLEYFTLSRCGHRTVKSIWCDEDCHTSVAEIYGTENKKEVIGGWHDAGDYGRYVVAGSKTVMDLLFAYEAAPKNKDFDILCEVRFELEWMLLMQREDGAVYHKISCYNFSKFVMPQDEKEVQVISPVSTAATADFAGCLAYASQFYKDSDPQFSKTLLESAIRAQKYIETHEDELYVNPADITTGSYSDKDIRDEKFFALCALFGATNDESYFEKALKFKNEDWSIHFSWGMVNGYGVEILLKNKDKVSNKAVIEKLEETVITRANQLMQIVKNASYKTIHSRVFWGSNGFVCDEAHVLLMAYKLTGNKEFYEGAKSQLDYLMGCNPLNICFVTGFGSKTVCNPHHRPSGAKKQTMPGMLSGGPSAGLQDAVARENLSGKAPLSCFIDHMGSYSTNEVAIYWNSPLVLLMAALNLV